MNVTFYFHFYEDIRKRKWRKSLLDCLSLFMKAEAQNYGKKVALPEEYLSAQTRFD